MCKKIDLSKLLTVTGEELSKNTDVILRKVDDGCGPILIRNEGCSDLLLFAWDDYFSRFGALYSPEERAAIEEGCKNCKDTE